jgi:NAD(P)-dependent dehydrogenase (short-subunit alcohol dehydrogenase family)
MARSMACELGPNAIRVNSLSPGHIYTKYAFSSMCAIRDANPSSRMTAAYLDKQPHLLEKWSSMNPMGRLGRSDELRGTITWLASDASSFCTGSE